MEEVAASFQGPPGQGRAAVRVQEQLRSRARSGLCTGCSCTQLPAGTRTPNFMCRQWHSKCYSRCGWQGAWRGWAQIITRFFLSSFTPVEAAQLSPVRAGAGEALPGHLDSAPGQGAQTSNWRQSLDSEQGLHRLSKQHPSSPSDKCAQGRALSTKLKQRNHGVSAATLQLTPEPPSCPGAATSPNIPRRTSPGVLPALVLFLPLQLPT